MRYQRFAFPLTVLTMLTLCLAGAAFADDLQIVGNPDTLGFSARRLARMTSWFEAQSQKGDPSGFVVGIVKDGKLAYLQPTGLRITTRKFRCGRIRSSASDRCPSRSPAPPP
jgi:hypothetical protein